MGLHGETTSFDTAYPETCTITLRRPACRRWSHKKMPCQAVPDNDANFAVQHTGGMGELADTGSRSWNLSFTYYDPGQLLSIPGHDGTFGILTMFE